MRTSRMAAWGERGALGLLLGVAALSWSLFGRATGLTLEDAWITFRYAENLAAGNGLVFNVGERVLGTTTPLLALLLGTLGLVFGAEHIPPLASIVLILCSLGTGLFVHLILKRSGFAWPWALVGAGIVLLHPDIAWVTAGGMETPLVLLLMSGSLYWAGRRHWGALGVTTGLLLLTRPDGLIWTIAVFLAVWRLDRRGLLVSVGAHLATVAPWVVFALLYYGTPVPHSVVAKLTIPPRSVSSATYLDALPAYVNWFLDGIGIPMRGRVASMEFAGFALWAGLFVAGGVHAVKRGSRDPSVALVLYLPLFCLAFYLGRAPAVFPWYLVPFTWACLVLVALGVSSAGSRLLRRSRGRAATRIAWGAAAVLVAAILTDRIVDDYRGAVRAQRASQQYEVAARQTIGLWLREHTDEDAAIAMEAIGYQGALARRRIIDLAGLVSPEVVRIARECRTNGEFYNRVLRDLEPDYLVLRATEITKNQHFFGGPTFDDAAQREYFVDHYALIRIFSGPSSWEPNARLLLFGRKG